MSNQSDGLTFFYIETDSLQNIAPLVSVAVPKKHAFLELIALVKIDLEGFFDVLYFNAVLWIHDFLL